MFAPDGRHNGASHRRVTAAGVQMHILAQPALIQGVAVQYASAFAQEFLSAPEGLLEAQRAEMAALRARLSAGARAQHHSWAVLDLKGYLEAIGSTRAIALTDD